MYCGFNAISLSCASVAVALQRDEKVKILETQVEELKDKSSKDRLQREKADEESRRYKDRYETQQSSFLELQSEVETLRSRLRATEDGILEKDQKREEEQSKRESQICQLEVSFMALI